MADEYSYAYQYTGGITLDYDEDQYRKQHLEQYPNGWDSETESRYRRYAEMTPEVNSKRNFYESTSEVYGGVPPRRKVYTKQIGDISNMRPEGHAVLKQPAADCADAHLEYARGRHEFLDKEPFAYQNVSNRVAHQGYAIDNYHLAELFRERLSLHEHEALTSIPAAVPSSASSGTRGRSRARSRPGISTIDDPVCSRSRRDTSFSRSQGGRPIQPLDEGSRGRPESRSNTTDVRPRSSVRNRAPSTSSNDSSSRSPSRPRTSTVRELGHPSIPSSLGPSSTYSTGDSRRRSLPLGPRPSTYGGSYQSRSQIRSWGRSSDYYRPKDSRGRSDDYYRPNYD